MSAHTQGQAQLTFILSMPVWVTPRRMFSKESHANSGSSNFTPHDEQLDNIMAALHEINTKISGLATIMHSQHICFDTKFTSLQIQMDEIQRKLEENGD